MKYVPESQNWSGEKKLTSGRYSGKRWSDIPDEILEFYHESTFGYFKTMAGYELKRREKITH